MSTLVLVPATESQLKFIGSLESKKDLTLEWSEGTPIMTPEWYSTKARSALSIFRALQRNGVGDLKRRASEVIDALKLAPYKAPAAKTPAEVESEAKIEGMHQTNWGIFKVQKAVHGSGRLYAKKLIQNESGKWVFEYYPGAIGTLSASTKMTMEAAAEFGALYGVCAVCARTLTDEESIERGIGPVCASRI